MGYVRGREKAFTLKMQAQQALCLMYTERNTRFVACRFLSALTLQYRIAIVQPSKGQLPKQAPSRIAC